MKTTKNAYKEWYKGMNILVERKTKKIRCNSIYCECGKKQWFSNINNFDLKHGLEY